MPAQPDLDRRLRPSFCCDDGHVVLGLDGDLDTTSLADACLALELAAGTHETVTVDCGGLQYADALGLRFLISARDRAVASGGDVIAPVPVLMVERLASVMGEPSPITVQTHSGPGTPCPHVLDPAAICQAALAAAVRLSGARRGNLQLVNPVTGDLCIVAQHGFEQPFLDYFAIVADTSSACGAALRLGTPVWVDDVTHSPIFAGTEAGQVVIDSGARAVASLPVRAPGDEIIAMISVHHDEPADWPRWHRHHLEQVALLTGSLARSSLPAA